MTKNISDGSRQSSSHFPFLRQEPVLLQAVPVPQALLLAVMKIPAVRKNPFSLQLRHRPQSGIARSLLM